MLHEGPPPSLFLFPISAATRDGASLGLPLGVWPGFAVKPSPQHPGRPSRIWTRVPWIKVCFDDQPREWPMPRLSAQQGHRAIQHAPHHLSQQEINLLATSCPGCQGVSSGLPGLPGDARDRRVEAGDSPPGRPVAPVCLPATLATTERGRRRSSLGLQDL